MNTYISYISEQSHILSKQDISGLLAKSRFYNEQKGITGILINFEGIFVQYIEGQDIEIKNLYDKILKDSRHKNIKLLFSDHHQTRFYKEWSMAYKQVPKEEVIELLGYREFNKEDFFIESRSFKLPHPGIELLKTFVSGLHVA